MRSLCYFASTSSASFPDGNFLHENIHLCSDSSDKHASTCIRYFMLSLSSRAAWTLCAVILVLVVITVAHLHPDSGFTLPVLPSGRLFEPVYVHDLFRPEDRQLNTSQCIDAYPRLYHEADRARRWYTSRSGITAKMVDDAEKDGGNARLTIVNNNVSTLLLWISLTSSYTSNTMAEASTLGPRRCLPWSTR